MRTIGGRFWRRRLEASSRTAAAELGDAMSSNRLGRSSILANGLRFNAPPRSETTARNAGERSAHLTPRRPKTPHAATSSGPSRDLNPFFPQPCCRCGPQRRAPPAPLKRASQLESAADGFVGSERCAVSWLCGDKLAHPRCAGAAAETQPVLRAPKPARSTKLLGVEISARAS